jgi:putative heme-binding domain-containing protein
MRESARSFALGCAAAARAALGVLAALRGAAAEDATPAGSIRLREGFRVELLRSARAGEDSWVSMSFDERGRIVLGLDRAGVARLTLDEGGEPRFERLEDSLQHCRGVLAHQGAIFVSATDSKGFYRLRDLDGDGRFEEKTLLKALDYRSRYGHGSNQIVLGPDGAIYLVVGNDVSFPEGFDASSPYRDPRRDLLLPEPRDLGEDARVGTIVRTDFDGKRWEIIAGGFRNQVDVAFDEDGEMFTWDSDMEWDVGLPWYRPTRLSHVVSAGEYGWRWGSGKWPPHYADSLAANLETGLGSPTGMVFGAKSRFPPAFRKLLFMADWQHGRILAVRLFPEGASYRAESEVFVEGAPLNVCDLEFGPDGALYFITGGRGSQSGLYRVTHAGGESTAAVPTPAEEDSASTRAAADARRLRRALERFHSGPSPGAVDAAWPQLVSADRWIRFAARIAIERQPPAEWRERALAERRPMAAAMALLALARCGEAAELGPVLEALRAHPLADLDEETVLSLLRAAAVALARHGRPDPETAARAADRLGALFPHRSPLVTRELAELLVFLGAGGIPARTLDLIGAAHTQEEEIQLARTILRARDGWTRRDRERYLAWLRRAKGFRGGRLLPAAIRQMTDDFLAALDEGARAELAAPIASLAAPIEDGAAAPSPALVRRWTLAELLPELKRAESNRSFESGRRALAAAQCLRCHRVGADGTAIGPDLSAAGARYDLRMIAESILEPSKAIDPKYGVTSFVLDSGRALVGRVAHVSAETLVIETDPLAGTTEELPRRQIIQSRPSPVSPMPEGLADVLDLEQLLDLLAYLRAGGDAGHAAFGTR